ncbi:MAG: hypothetical protein ACRYFR_02010 [Janthinobacterium lividum]
MKESVLLAYCLEHLEQADGNQAHDWAVARLATARAQQVLRRHLVSPRLPNWLTVAAHAASEELRAAAARDWRATTRPDWRTAAAQARRVVPVALRVLAALPD